MRFDRVGRHGAMVLGALLLVPARGQAAPAAEPGEPDNSKPIISAPAREFSRKQLGIEAFYTRAAEDKGGDPLFWQPYEGRGRNLIDPAAFYSKVGREDLSSSYSRWTVMKPLLVIGGLGAMVGALFTLNTRPVAYALAGGGLVMFIVGYAANPHPVGAKEAATLAEAHNDALANRLGLRSVTVEGDGSQNPDVSATALTAYAKSYIDFDIHMTFENGVPDRSSRRWVPFQGKDKSSMDHPAFYKLMGRDDLASAYKRNQGVQVGFIVGGVGLILGGVLVAYNGFKDHNDSISYAGLGLAVGGIISFTIGRYYGVDPITEAEARELADEYNRNILRREGVPISSAEPPRRRPHRASARKSWGFVFPTSGGAGLGLAGVF